MSVDTECNIISQDGYRWRPRMLQVASTIFTILSPLHETFGQFESNEGPFRDVFFHSRATYSASFQPGYSNQCEARLYIVRDV